jgi:hypothetical protein
MAEIRRDDSFVDQLGELHVVASGIGQFLSDSSVAAVPDVRTDEHMVADCRIERVCSRKASQ